MAKTQQTELTEHERKLLGPWGGVYGLGAVVSWGGEVYSNTSLGSDLLMVLGKVGRCDAIRTALTSEDPFMRECAANAMGEACGRDSVPRAVARIRAQGEAFAVRRAGVYCLAKIGGSEASSALVECLQSPELAIRDCAVDAVVRVASGQWGDVANCRQLCRALEAGGVGAVVRVIEGYDATGLNPEYDLERAIWEIVGDGP